MPGNRAHSLNRHFIAPTNRRGFVSTPAGHAPGSRNHDSCPPLPASNN